MAKPKADEVEDTRTQVERDRATAQAQQDAVDKAVHDATHDADGNPVAIAPSSRPIHR